MKTEMALAAYLLLESERSINITGNKPLCLVSGWGNATDAHHQTTSSPEGKGASLTMTQALKMGAISSDEVDYINAHGTGTGNNDLSESAAFLKVFGSKLPPFSSTKGYTGHTLGAAGAIEAAFCVQSIINNCIFPDLNFSESMHETGLIPQLNFLEGVDINNVITNSFGFGGNCTSLLFSRA
jgi:3-oxoacyl-(acyl-carrier-protein) synthase